MASLEDINLFTVNKEQLEAIKAQAGEGFPEQVTGFMHMSEEQIQAIIDGVSEHAMDKVKQGAATLQQASKALGLAGVSNICLLLEAHAECVSKGECDLVDMSPQLRALEQAYEYAILHLSNITGSNADLLGRKAS